MNYNLLLVISLLVTRTISQTCPFDFNMGRTSSSCQGLVSESRVKGGQFFNFLDENKQVSLMVNYGNKGLFGVWNLTDASLLYTTNFYTENLIELHSIFIRQEVKQGIITQQNYIFTIDSNLNVYQQGLYEEKSVLILPVSSKVYKYSENIKVCYNIDKNTLFFPIDNKVYQIKSEQESFIELDSNGIQCESDQDGTYIYILTASSSIFQINQDTFKIYKKYENTQSSIIYLQYTLNMGMTFLSRNSKGDSIYQWPLNITSNEAILLFNTLNQINDYSFFSDNSLLACGSNSLIYFGSVVVDPSSMSVNTQDYDQENPINFSQINYVKLIIGEIFTVFYGSNIVTVVNNQTKNVHLNKIFLDIQFSGLTINGIIDNSTLKSLSSSGMIFLDLNSGQITRDTSCFGYLDVYEEIITGVYFDDELLRIYALENQGRFGYFSYPSGDYLTQFYNIKQNSDWLVNKAADQIYVWGQEIQNYLIVTTYYDGQLLKKIDLPNVAISQVQFDNSIGVIIIIDLLQAILVLTQDTFQQIQMISLQTPLYNIYSSQLGLVIVNQTTISLITKDTNINQFTLQQLHQNDFNFQQQYFDQISSQLIIVQDNKTTLLQNFSSNNGVPQSQQSINILKANQVTQNICYGSDYLVFLLSQPNSIVFINKNTNEILYLNDLTETPIKCLLVLNQSRLVVFSNGSQLTFINIQTLAILKKETLDKVNNIIKTEVDQQENLFIFLLENSKIISYNYQKMQQISDWVATAAPRTSTFQINTVYKMIVYGAALEIYFSDYSQKKLMETVQLSEAVQGGYIHYNENKLIVFTNKVYSFDLNSNNLILQSTFKHQDIITQLNIVEEWNLMITSSNDNTIAIYSYPSMEMKQILQHDILECQQVNLFTVEVGRDRIFSGCYLGSIYIWKRDLNLNSFSLSRTLPFFLNTYLVTHITIDVSNDFLFLIGYAWHSYIVQLSTIETTTSIVARLHGINGYYDQQNQVVIMTDHNGNVWNYSITISDYIFDKGTAIHQSQNLFNLWQGWVRSVVIDPKQKRFASMGDDSTVQVWPYNSADSQIPVFKYTNQAPVKTGYLDYDHSILIISDSNFRVVLLKYPLLQVLKVFEGHTDIVNKFIINQKNVQVLTFSNDNTIKIWDYELAVENGYYLIVKKSTSIMSYAYDKQNQVVYYARSEGRIQKWLLMSDQAENGLMLKDSDRFNNSIYLINKDIYVIATTQQVLMVSRDSQIQIDSSQVKCSHRVNKQEIIICGFHQQLIGYKVVKNNNVYQLQMMYNRKLNYAIYQIQEGIQSSTEFIIILNNHSAAFVESTTGIIAKSFPQIHSKLIVNIIIYSSQRLFSYSFDGQLVEYNIDQASIWITRKIQLPYQIYKVVINQDYIAVHQKENNQCLIYLNDNQSTFTLAQSLQTPSRWQYNIQIILSPENNSILLSSNFYYIIFDYQTFQHLFVYQSNLIVERNFMRRQVTIVQDNQIFVQQGEKFFVIASENQQQKNMKVIQTFINRNSFYDNIEISVTRVDNYNLITALSFNLGGINYFMTDTKGVMPCSQNLLDANYFDIKRRIRDYLNLRNNLLENNTDLMNHIFNLEMSKSFTFYGFPQISSNFQMLIQLTINGLDTQSQIQGSFYFNSIKNSQNLISLKLNNIKLVFESENQQAQKLSSLQNISFISCQMEIKNPPLIMSNLQDVLFRDVNLKDLILNSSSAIFEINDTKRLTVEETKIINNNIDAKTLLIYQNSLNNNLSSEFIFKKNIVQDNKINKATLFQVELVSSLQIENNTIENNNSSQNSFFFQTVLVMTMVIQSMEFHLNSNLALISYQPNLRIDFDLMAYNVEVNRDYFELSSSSITNNQYHHEESYLINCQSSQILISKTEISHQLAQTQQNLITFSSGRLNIDELNFNNNECLSHSLFSILSSKNVNVSKSTFTINKSLALVGGGGVFYISKSNITISSSEFKYNQAQNGGALYLDEETDGLLQDTLFLGNTARENGGALLLNNSDVSIEKSTFNQNSALIGGAIRYLIKKPKFLETRNLLTVKDSCGTYFENICMNNKGEFYGKNICSYPQSVNINSIELNNNGQYSFYNVQSGTYEQKLVIHLFDQEGTKVQFKSSTTTPVSTRLEFQEYRVQIIEKYLLDNSDISKRDIKLDGATLKPFQDDSFLLNQYSVSGQLEKVGKTTLLFYGFKFFSEQSQRFTESVSLQVNYNFRSCLVGEIMQQACSQCSLIECKPCQNGTYSIVDPKEYPENLTCKPCDYEKSIECQANQIKLRKGYWRKSIYDDNILYCSKSKDRCNGIEETNYCSEGLIGPLCETCDTQGSFWKESYGRVSFGLDCIKCQTQKIKILPQIALTLSLIFYLTYLFFLTKINLNMMIKNLILEKTGLIRLGTSGQIGEQTFYSRILIRYLQIFTIISSLNSNIYDIFRVSFVFLSPISSNQDSFDCFLNKLPKAVPIYYYKTIGQVIIPFFIIPITFTLYFSCVNLVKRLRKSSLTSYNLEYQKDATIICLIFLFFFLQQSAFESLIQPLNCKKIGDKKYISFYLIEECYSTSHITLIATVVLPFIFLWVFLIPAILMWNINNKSKKIGNFSNDFKMTRQYGFLFYGYKKQCYLWEFLPMNLRLILVFIVAYFDDAILVRATLILVCLYLYVLFLEKHKPYQKQQHYNIDVFCSKACCMLTIISTFLNVTESLIVQYFGQAIMMGLQFIVFFRIMRMYLDVFIRLNYHYIKKNCLFKCIKQCLVSAGFCTKMIRNILKPSMPSLYLLIYQTECNSFKKFNNFQLLRLHVQDFIQRKKKDQKAPFFQSIQAYEEKCQLISLNESSIDQKANRQRKESEQFGSQSIRKLLLSNRISCNQSLHDSQRLKYKDESPSPIKFQILGNQINNINNQTISRSNVSNFSQNNLQQNNKRKLSEKISLKFCSQLTNAEKQEKIDETDIFQSNFEIQSPQFSDRSEQKYNFQTKCNVFIFEDFNFIFSQYQSGNSKNQPIDDNYIKNFQNYFDCSKLQTNGNTTESIGNEIQIQKPQELIIDDFKNQIEKQQIVLIKQVCRNRKRDR